MFKLERTGDAGRPQQCPGSAKLSQAIVSYRDMFQWMFCSDVASVMLSAGIFHVFMKTESLRYYSDISTLVTRYVGDALRW